MKDSVHSIQNQSASNAELLQVSETENASRFFFIIKTNRANGNEIDQALIDFYLS